VALQIVERKHPLGVAFFQDWAAEEVLKPICTTNLSFINS
jgi:hypothetical protein